jgi:hypothetical protein
MSFGVFRMKCIIAVKQKGESIEPILSLVKMLGNFRKLLIHQI